MHYKNGRPAKDGDKVVNLSTGQAGVLHSSIAQSTTCNGRLAPINQNDPYVTIGDCLHEEDAARLAQGDGAFKAAPEPAADAAQS